MDEHLRVREATKSFKSIVHYELDILYIYKIPNQKYVVDSKNSDGTLYHIIPNYF